MRPLYYDSSRVVDARARLTRDRPRGRIGPTEVTMNGAANERQELNISKLTPHIGAEVHGVDLSRPLDEPTFKRVHDALIDNQVIFFRDQHITPDQQKAFGRRFGELAVHPAAPGLVEGHPEILVVHADEKSKHVAGENWHSDVSCDPEPPMEIGRASCRTECRP